MNRSEALRILGLDDDATADDIKTAYRETVQILHPDKFSGNKKLQDRATEQFKNLQEAYECLTSGKAADPSSNSSSSASSYSSVDARIAGIQAARTQLVKQKDVLLDERKTGIGMAAVGAAVALLTVRRSYGIWGVLFALASAAAVWGVVQVISCQKSIDTLDEHIKQLRAEERALRQEE